MFSKGTAHASLFGLTAFAAWLIASPALARSGAPDSCAPPPASPIVVNVKDKGAKGDGQTDDTAAIQAAIDAVAGTKGTVFVPDGIYMVDATGKERLTLKSYMTLKLSSGATLKAFPNDAQHYNVLTISGGSHIWVIGGTLEGERGEHKNNRGEWGMGIHINKNAKHITVSNVTSMNMWGDGFYVEGAEDVRFCSVVADSNRRQGLSVIEADGLLVSHSLFQNTHGTRPGAGIDFEPDRKSQNVTNIRVQASNFFDNAGGGIRLTGKKGDVANMVMTGNLFRGNVPFVVKHAPQIAATICDNRQENVQSETARGFNAFPEPIMIVAHQSDCGDTAFVLQHQSKKKKE